MPTQPANPSDEGVVPLTARVAALESRRDKRSGTFLSVLALIVACVSAYGTYRNSEASTRSVAMGEKDRKLDLRVRDWEFPGWDELATNPDGPKIIQFRVINKGIPVSIESIILTTLDKEDAPRRSGEIGTIINAHGKEVSLHKLFTKYGYENATDKTKLLPFRLDSGQGEIFSMSYSVDLRSPRVRLMTTTGEELEYLVYEPPPPGFSGGWGYNDGGGRPVYDATDD